MLNGDRRADPRKLAIVLGIALLVLSIVAVVLYVRMVYSVGMAAPR